MTAAHESSNVAGSARSSQHDSLLADMVDVCDENQDGIVNLAEVSRLFSDTEAVLAAAGRS